jgi:hypothetical protein
MDIHCSWTLFQYIIIFTKGKFRTNLFTIIGLLKLKTLLHGKTGCISLAVCNFCIVMLVCLHIISSCILLSRHSLPRSFSLWYNTQIGLLFIEMEKAFHLFLSPNNIATRFPFVCSHVLYTMCLCLVMLLWTSWPQTTTSYWSEINSCRIFAVQDITCVHHATFDTE